MNIELNVWKTENGKRTETEACSRSGTFMIDCGGDTGAALALGHVLRVQKGKAWVPVPAKL